MFKWIKEKLGIKPNDWIDVWYDFGKWNITHNYDFYSYVTKELSHYYIQHSESRNEYKLVLEGWKPTEHSVYEGAMNKLIELQTKEKGAKDR